MDRGGRVDAQHKDRTSENDLRPKGSSQNQVSRLKIVMSKNQESRNSCTINLGEGAAVGPRIYWGPYWNLYTGMWLQCPPQEPKMQFLNRKSIFSHPKSTILGSGKSFLGIGKPCHQNRTFPFLWRTIRGFSFTLRSDCCEMSYSLIYLFFIWLCWSWVKLENWWTWVVEEAGEGGRKRRFVYWWERMWEERRLWEESDALSFEPSQGKLYDGGLHQVQKPHWYWWGNL